MTKAKKENMTKAKKDNTFGDYYLRYKDELEPCPCCGNDDLYVGHLASTNMGVHCWLINGNGCNLQLPVDMFSNPVRNKIRTIAAREDAAAKEAVRRWNRRQF